MGIGTKVPSITTYGNSSCIDGKKICSRFSLVSAIMLNIVGMGVNYCTFDFARILLFCSQSFFRSSSKVFPVFSRMFPAFSHYFPGVFQSFPSMFIGFPGFSHKVFPFFRPGVLRSRLGLGARLRGGHQGAQHLRGRGVTPGVWLWRLWCMYYTVVIIYIYMHM